MLWYRRDGSKQGTALYQVEEHATVDLGAGAWWTQRTCPAYKVGLPVF